MNFEENEQKQLPAISEFFTGKVVAITGATGGVGQALVAKLLISCRNITHIYLLIRCKRHLSPNDRLVKLFKLPAFDRVREAKVNLNEKVSALACDLLENQLALTIESRRIIEDRVHVFIHCAASVKFNEPLTTSYQVNVQSVRQVMLLCEKIKNLKSFVHVSTAYSQCNRRHIEERNYQLNMTYEQLGEIVNSNKDQPQLINKLVSSSMDGRPNNYTFTKAMAENIVADDCWKIPRCVVRPSVIVAAYDEPQPGWCSNVYGATCFLLGVCHGLTRIALGDENVKIDFVPLDVVVNACICAAVETATIYASHIKGKQEREESRWSGGDELAHNDGGFPYHHVKFYNVVSTNSNPITIGETSRWYQYWAERYPLQAFRAPNYQKNLITTSRLKYEVVTAMCTTLPCFIADVFLIILRRQNNFNLTTHARLMHQAMKLLSFFFLNEFTWRDDNCVRLQSKLHKQDQQKFNLSCASYTWKEHMRRYVRGLKQFIIREEMSNYPQTRRHISRLSLVERIMKVAVFLLALRFLTKRNHEKLVELLRFLHRMMMSLFNKIVSHRTYLIPSLMQS